MRSSSRTITEGAIGTVVPTVVVWLFPALTAICVAAPAVPVAVNVTGEPVSPADVAVRVLLPAVVPSVQLVTAAIPLAFVAIAVVGTTVPPPDATAKVTFTPLTGLLLASRTMTEGATATAVPAVALWPFPALIAICVAAPGVTVTVGNVEVTLAALIVA